jgi:hypothetical protein
MGKYLVRLRRTQSGYAEIEVEAESQELAEAKAYNMWEQDCDNSQFDWETTEDDCVVADSERLHEEEA